MLQMLKKDKINIIIFIVSMLTTVTIGINLDKTVGLAYSFQGNSFYYVALMIFYCVILKKVINNSNKRLVICVGILSLLLTFFEIVGFSINTYTDLSAIFTSKVTLLKCVLKAFGVFVTLYSVITIIYGFIDTIIHRNKIEKEQFSGEANPKTKSKRLLIFFGIWILIFLLYLPWFLQYYPGILSFDSVNQIKQCVGEIEMTSAHPIFHTAIIKVCLGIGQGISGSLEAGVGIYIILQMLFMSGVFAYAIHYMTKRNVNIYIRILTFIFFAFYPVMSMYSVTMWKDVPFSVSLILLVICMSELVHNQEKYLNSKVKNMFLVLVLLLVMLLRNNGLYVVVITVPFMMWFARKHWKKVGILAILSIIIYELINGPLLSILQIKKGSVREALSVPLQQLARVEINKKMQLTEQEYEQIHHFIRSDNIAGIYKTWLSDPIKDCFNDDYFNANKGEFVNLWIKLFIKYPVQYFEAFFCNSVGYWYPETSYRVVTEEMYTPKDGVKIERTPVINSKLVAEKNDLIEKRQLPIASMTLSIGFQVWLLFIGTMYLIYRKRYGTILLYIPVFALWLTILASPVYAEFRYIFGVFTCLPILIACTINMIGETGEKNETKTS